MKGFDSRQTGRVVASSSDISLIIDPAGEVIDIAYGDSRVVIEPAEDWIGMQWIDTVSIECRGKVRDLLAIDSEHTPSGWRQINHPVENGGPDIPILYRALARDDDGHLIVVGRDLRPFSDLQQQLMDLQHSMEQDYSRLRQAEKRYRVLFTLASEGILIIEADSRRVVEANPAAGEMLKRPAGKMVGRSFPKGFTDASEDAIEALLTQVRAAGSADDILVRSLIDEAAFNFGATLLKREEGVFFLVRISPHKRGDQPPANQALMDVVQRSPDAFVVTDPEARILTANTAFLDLCQLESEKMVQQPLDRWIGRAGVDVEMLRKNLLQRGQVKHFNTTLKPEFEEPIEVELSAVAALDAETPCLGFVIRHNMRRTPVVEPDPEQPFARSIQDMTDLVGRVPLRDLVRETSDIIERLCIEAALRATNDNRASAAELLGLSRQSLYVKLRRYGLEDFSVDKKT